MAERQDTNLNAGPARDDDDLGPETTARLRQQLFRAVTASSLALCLSTLVLICLGHRGGRAFRLGDRDWWLDKRMLVVNRYELVPVSSAARLPASRPAEQKVFPGIRLGHDRMDQTGSYMDHRFIRFDYPAIVLMTSILPMLFVLTKLRRMCPRADAGKCSRCGYDLRASKDRCPECGKPIPIPRPTACRPTRP